MLPAIHPGVPGAEKLPRLLPQGRRAVFAQLAVWVAEQRGRADLWLPVGFGLGILGYFALAFEPPVWAGAGASGLLAVLTVAVRRSRARLAVLVLLATALGFAAAQQRTHGVATVLLDRQTWPLRVEGTVVGVDRLEDALRVVLSDPVVERFAPERTPRRVRVRLHRDDPRPPVGARIAVRVILNPPPGPAEPGAFDFRRHAYFQGLGGVGFALAPAEILAPPAGRGLSLRLEALRQEIAARVAGRLTGAEAAVTTALLNGEPSAIPEADLEALRISGLQHLLSISGLHIGLVAGLVFFVVRVGLALSETLALRAPIKKIAAVAALVAAAGYALLVGAPVPTQRAVLMTGIVLLAILLDRSPFSQRMVAMAAAVVLLFQPEALLGPSFQMSFAAVVALIAVYEALRDRLSRWRSHAGPLRRAALYVGGVALTSLVAGLATLPFSVFHFQQMAVHGVLANLIAVPITSFWIMPWGLVACLLMPFGLEAWAVDAMGLGVAAMLATAHWVAGLPAADLSVVALPPLSLGLATLGGLWFAIWRGGLRYAGALPVVAAVAIALPADLPDLRIAESGRVLAVRGADGGLLLSSGRAGRFEVELWQRRDGNGGNRAAREREAPAGEGDRESEGDDGIDAGDDSTATGPTAIPWPPEGIPAAGLVCDGLGCIYRRNGWTVALPRRPDALAEDCARADLVVTHLPAPGCAAPHTIDAGTLAMHGAYAVWLRPDGIRIARSRPARTARPWHGTRAPETPLDGAQTQ